MELYSNQQKIADELGYLHGNFKKTPKDRRTKQYLKSLQSELEEKWIQFIKNDKAIQQITNYKTSEYYTTNFTTTVAET